VEVSKPVKIFRNARIAQMIFFKTGETEGYKGVYNKEDLLKFGRRANV